MKKIFILAIFLTSFNQSYSQNALSFDGTNDYVTVPDNSALDITGSITIEVWLYPTNSSATQVIVGKTDGANASDLSYMLRITTAGIRFEVGNGIGAVNSPLADFTIFTLNTWHHVVGYFNTNTDRTGIYVDGVEIGTPTNGPTGSLKATNASLLIGIFSNVYSQYFIGKIDEVRIWNTAQTASQIQDNMFKELVGNESGLVGNWKFNDGTGITATNSVSGGGSGTLTNFALSGSTSNWVTSYAPMSSLQSSYTTSQKSIWQTTGTNASNASNGLHFTVASTLSEANFMSYGNNNTSSVAENDLTGTSCVFRTGRIWYLDVTGTVSATATIDITDATGVSITAATASNYKLLRRDGTSGNFSVVAEGSSIANTDQVTFGSSSFSDGYYAVGTLNNSASPLPVELKSFQARQLNGSVILSWITATESANFGFDVERKTGNTNWEKIGFVKGNGTSTSEKYYTFKDDGVKKGKYSYRLKQIDRDGTFEYHKTAEVTIGLNPTKIVLDENYPNPFNSTTVINYQIPKTGNVEIKLFNLLGKEIVTIVNEIKEEGFHEVKFNSGNIPSGVYYYKLQSNNQTEIKKMVLMK